MSIELADVRFRYAAANSDALKGLSLKVPAGQFSVVTGNLGSGCSTLLQVMAGLAPRHTGGVRNGRVSVLGYDPGTEAGAAALRGRVGLLLPSPWIQLSGMTFSVRDEVAFGPGNLGWPIERIWASVDRVMDRLNLAHLAERDPVTLSGGELQRTILAGLLAMEPELLLLDEPVQELDPHSAAYVLDLLLQQSGVTTVVATADQDLAARYAEYVFVLHDGAVVAHGRGHTPLGSGKVVAVGSTTTIGSLFRTVGHSNVPVTIDEAVECLRR